MYHNLVSALKKTTWPW